jgi:translation initiation factor IF-3
VGFRRRRWRDLRPDEDKVRVNRAIRIAEVRVVNEDGQQLGIMPTDAALDIAQRIGLDLVEIAPTARPPVCKIMDYGKYKYEAKKKAAASKKTQHQSQLKEIKFRPRIDENDLNTKMNQARRFLMEGDKVKCTVMFRGREIVHAHVGHQLLKTVEARLLDIATIEGRPSMEGRTLSVGFAGNRQAIDKLKAQIERQKKLDAEAGIETAPEPEVEELVDEFEGVDLETDEEAEEGNHA